MAEYGKSVTGSIDKTPLISGHEEHTVQYRIQNESVVCAKKNDESYSFVLKETTVYVFHDSVKEQHEEDFADLSLYKADPLAHRIISIHGGLRRAKLGTSSRRFPTMNSRLNDGPFASSPTASAHCTK
ncbi:hypothetical protein CBL_14461 [Carabus blaptoides fortunei]